MVSTAKLATNAGASLLVSFIARLSVALVQKPWIKTLLKMIVNLLFLVTCPNFTAESDRRPAFSLSPMLPTLRPDLNEHLYLRDPQATALGRRLPTESVRLLDKIGFGAFTFKRLTLALVTVHAPTFAPPATLDRNEEALYRVVMAEASKAYPPKESGRQQPSRPVSEI